VTGCTRAPRPATGPTCGVLALPSSSPLARGRVPRPRPGRLGHRLHRQRPRVRRDPPPRPRRAAAPVVPAPRAHLRRRHPRDHRGRPRRPARNFATSPQLEGTPLVWRVGGPRPRPSKPSEPATPRPRASPMFAPHQARVDYGRVIAGRGFLSARGDGPPVLTDIFTVGTRFSVDSMQSLQVGFLGPHPRQLRARHRDRVDQRQRLGLRPDPRARRDRRPLRARARRPGPQHPHALGGGPRRRHRVHRRGRRRGPHRRRRAARQGRGVQPRGPGADHPGPGRLPLRPRARHLLGRRPPRRPRRHAAVRRGPAARRRRAGRRRDDPRQLGRPGPARRARHAPPRVRPGPRADHLADAAARAADDHPPDAAIGTCSRRPRTTTASR
jgi:hypothetical protein